MLSQPPRSKPLTFHSTAILPRTLSHTLTVEELSATALKVFFYVLAKHQHRLRHHSPAADTVPQQEGPVVLRRTELHHYLSSQDSLTAPRPYNANAYIQIRSALEALVGTVVRCESPAPHPTTRRATVWRAFALVSSAEGFSDGTIEVELSPRIHDLLRQIGLNTGNFTLVRLRQLSRLHSPRSIRVLLWAYEFRRLHSPTLRTIPLATLRRALGMEAQAYENWKEVRKKLRSYTDQVNSVLNPSLYLTAVPVLQGKVVVAVRFDVTKQQEDPTDHAVHRQKPRPTAQGDRPRGLPPAQRARTHP